MNMLCRVGVRPLLRSSASLVLLLYTWNGENLPGVFLLFLETGLLCVALAIYPGTHSVNHPGFSDLPASASRKLCSSTTGFLGL